jgi:hypothetical protein
MHHISKQVAGHIAFVLPSNKRSARAILRAAERIVDAGKHGPWGDGTDYKDHRPRASPTPRLLGSTRAGRLR